MHYAKIKRFDIANGVGIRTSVFVSGCSNKCKRCFNQELWDKNYGQEFTDETIKEILNSIDKPYIDGLSILGGDPLEYYNLEMVDKLIVEFRKRFGFNKSIWMWTGYRYEELNELQKRIVSKVDVLIDGKFEIENKNPSLRFRGSSNQRVIDIHETILNNKIVLLDI